MMIEPEKKITLRHEIKHQISICEDLVLSQNLRKIFSHDPYVGSDGTYQVTSLYFDTPYDRALRQKTDGSDRREKFRLRYYGRDTSHIRLEKKIKIKGMCGKRSTEITREQTKKLLEGKLDFLLEGENALFIELYSKLKGEKLEPKTIVRYDREAFTYYPGNVRITLDRNTRTGYQNRDFLNTEVYSIPVMCGETILEVKYDEFLPDLVCLAIKGLGRRSSSCSKYAMCRMYE